MYINKIVKLLFFILIATSLYACDQKKEDEQTKKKKEAMRPFVALEAKYDSFIPEPMDEVPLDQEAYGLKWYLDSKAYPPSSPELPEAADKSETASKLLTPFTLHLYKSDDVKSIELSYNLDKDNTYNWLPLYQVKDLDAKKTSLYIDYQDYKLFGFDFFLPPAMLKATMTWADDVVHELYIDPENQKEDVHIKGLPIEGLISEGIFENKVLLLRNISGLTWTVEIHYNDARLKEAAKNTQTNSQTANPSTGKATPNDETRSDNQPLVLTLKTNISKVIHISSFMAIETIKIKTPYEDFHQTITPEKVFSPGAWVGCIVMNFTVDNLTVTPLQEKDFASCYPGFKDYKTWVLTKMPEINEQDAEKSSIKGKLPSSKNDDW